MKRVILSDREAEQLLKSSLVEGVKWLTTARGDTLMYGDNTMNFVVLPHGVLVETY